MAHLVTEDDSGDVLEVNSYFIVGTDTTDQSMRLKKNGSNTLAVETRVSGVWVDSPIIAHGDLDNRVVVNQSNFLTTICGTIDSAKEYFLDGVIDVGSNEINVPSGGIAISGFNFNLSKLVSTSSSFILFNSASCGDVLMKDIAIEISGTGSSVYALTDSNGLHAYEIARVNFNNCSSMGYLDNFRQGFETGTGRFGGQPELELRNPWLGGYFIDSSIARSLTDGAYSLFKAGVGFTMASRFRSNQNIDLPTSASFFDFAPSNFINPSTVQIKEAKITRNGVSDSSDTNITPNMTEKDLSSSWTGNNGMPNTIVGGVSTVSVEALTTISVVSTYYDLLGTYTPTELQHFDSPSNGQLRHLGKSPREFKIIANINIEGGANDDLSLKVEKWDDSASAFVDVFIQGRQVNNLVGGRDLAFFIINANLTLDQNDYIRLQVANNTDLTNVTVESTSYFNIEER